MSVAAARPSRTVPRHALRRGTRGFAAVVLFLTASIALSVAGFILPASAIAPGVLTVLVPLAITFGVAHVVAAYGIARRRAWSVPLVLYLLAIGLGVAGFGALLVATGVDPFARPGAVDSSQSRAEVLGLLAWLAGSWLVAARFTMRGMAPATPARGETASAPAAVHAITPVGTPARALTQAMFLLREPAGR
jgi:hypothetical protein